MDFDWIWCLRLTDLMTFLILIKWEKDTLNEYFCTFLCTSWTLYLSLLFLFCRFFFFLFEIITITSIITWYLTQVLVSTCNMIFLQDYMLHILHISYLNHIIHSMTCYMSVVQRMYRIVNSNLYAIIWLPYLWQLQCSFLFNNIVYVFIMICKQYCWHSSKYLSQS